MSKTKIIIVIACLLLPLKVFALIINEVAWMGTEIQWQNEWIELYNEEDKKIDLNGWILKNKDKGLLIKLEGSVEPFSYFLLERTDDTTLPEIKADQIYKGGLNNKGEYLILLSKAGETVEELDCSLGWPAGNNETKKTMERKNDSWQTSLVKGGTPKEANSELEKIAKKPLKTVSRWKSKFPSILSSGLGISIAFTTIFYLKLNKKHEWT